MSADVAGKVLPPLTPQQRARWWGVLLLASALVSVVFELLHVPAALLLGPMVAAIGVALRGGAIAVPKPAFALAQGLIGCLIARSITPPTLGGIAADWPLFAAGVVFVIAASGGLGWWLARAQVLPGTTAVWGSAPGAASAMVLMSEVHGADARLVALMQYLRVGLVVAMSSLVAKLWVGGPATPAAHMDWFPPIDALALLQTLALVAAGVAAARGLRLPSAGFLVPIVGGIALQAAGLMTLELPPWLLLAGYALIGWSIGLRFTRGILVHAARALPRVLASILALMAVCGLFAAGLAVFAGIDPLTAYLATSPGGADSVAIIAATSHVDVPFVVAMQTLRFVVVLLIGPSLARLIASRVAAPPPWQLPR
jgi:membrane AbrB-like protein